MRLEDLRRKIDETDAQIVRSIAERIRIAEEIGKGKREKRQQVEDKEREVMVFENVKRIAQEEKVNQEDMHNIYRHIVTACKRMQGVD